MISQIAVTVHTEGSRWRLDRLSDPARQALTGGRGQQNWSGRVFSDDDILLFQALSDDPRQPASRLAEKTGLSPTTIRRRLDRLDAGRAVVYRCEVARYVSGYPISVSLGGHLLDPHGRNLRSVPLGFWTDPTSDAAEDELLVRLRQPPGSS